MNKEEASESIDILGYWLKEVSAHNDLVKSTTASLKSLMFTLAIQAEKNDSGSKAAIKVIAQEVEKTIKTLNESTNNLINKGRTDLYREFGKLSKYIKE